ncbi:hypothetical protein FA13DRAFT_764915 [Coprinellus micaceus]|uniref:Uncharacterized protein n=1 Tax=Coprinellus micaceus TaxID=71717 RepID=A0A4Y7S986_COPMI|nr:hypothetical protein FA13DRAFT_764915 [Coprinellus micaceus]
MMRTTRHFTAMHPPSISARRKRTKGHSFSGLSLFQDAVNSLWGPLWDVGREKNTLQFHGGLCELNRLSLTYLECVPTVPANAAMYSRDLRTGSIEKFAL